VPGARIGGRALDLRLDMALSLYEKGMAPIIIVSGGQGEDELTTEAEYMAEYLNARGVPKKALLLEDQSVSLLILSSLPMTITATAVAKSLKTMVYRIRFNRCKSRRVFYREGRFGRHWP